MYKRFLKRVFDFCIALLSMPFLLIVIIIMAPIIHFTDGGPVFYNAKRLGKDGKLFTMYKFRSMYVNAPDIRLSDGSTYNGADDPRVTGVGRFMRANSIDELPQLLNVLNGTMSLIGPRPDLPDDLERYPEEVKVLLTVRPGLTGYCQAYWRNGVTSGEKMEADAYYATHVTFLFDLKIIVKTIAMVFSHTNIYRDTSSENEELSPVCEIGETEE